MLNRLEIRIDEELASRLAGLFLGMATIGPVKIERSSKAFLDMEREKISEIRRKFKLDLLKEEELIRAYRRFYWALRIDPTKVRPSSEALIRRSLQGAEIPKINNVVDAYNMASMETLIPMGAFDLDRIKPPIIMRYSRPGEKFVKIGGFEEELVGNELVLADAEKVINRYPHRDSDLTKVTFDTSNVLLIIAGIPGVEEKNIATATKKACIYITSFAGGKYEIWIQPHLTR
ncbi:MAG TPA: phenylalanine--tRNA ligase beta subunit-related protein [Candidatus Bathyarchaeia archaeon]|nr:phenylalanine--tRNA ligase beta subunit-related protein [Candidatus Bathyarchaeia archaeon]